MDMFIAKVVDVVNDPEKSGRLKIRVFGTQDDESAIPDSDLRWARCVFPVTHAITGGVSGPTVGATVGTIVTGYYADSHHQIPLVTGTLGRSNDESADFPQASIGKDVNSILKNNIFHVGSSEIKFAESKTIGSIKYTGQNIKDLLTTVKSGNISLAISQVKGVINQVNQLKTMLTSNPTGQINSIVSGFYSDITSGSAIGGLLGSTALSSGLSSVTSATNALNAIKGNASVLVTAGGNIFPTLGGDLASTVSQFSDISHIVGNINGKTLQDGANIINRLSGNKFVMNTTMKSLGSTLQTLKSLKNVKSKILG